MPEVTIFLKGTTFKHGQVTRSPAKYQFRGAVKVLASGGYIYVYHKHPDGNIIERRFAIRDIKRGVIVFRRPAACV